jgi:excisionase family DNA binding protein
MEALVTRKEVARLLRCSLASLHRMMRQEALPSLKVGGKTLFRRADLEMWLHARARHAPAEPDMAPDNQRPSASALLLGDLTQAGPSGEQALVALLQATVDEEHPTVLSLRHDLSPETLAQARAMLAAHGVALHTRPAAMPDIVAPSRDAEGREIILVIELKAVRGGHSQGAQGHRAALAPATDP